MDYNYIRLENQIKALMNQNHVPSSTISKIAESMKKGTLELYIDTVNKQFVFKHSGINNPISIDSINSEILHVRLLNGVDVTSLIGGITNGYGVTIEETSRGIYKVSVNEGMFALTTDIANIEGKFDDYTTTADLEANYATKHDVAKVEEELDDYATKNDLSLVDSKFGNYTTTEDLANNYLGKTYTETVDAKLNEYARCTYVDTNYATKAEVVTVEEKFDDYAKLTDLDDYTKKTDVVPSIDSQFDIVEGYPDYYVENGHIHTYYADDMYPGYNVMQINDLIQKIEASTTPLDIFRVTLRKQLLLDYDGNILNNFLITFDPSDEDKKYKSVKITYNGTNDCYIAESRNREKPEIIIDSNCTFLPLAEFIKGDLVIEYLLSQTALRSREPNIQCDIIEAKNALKLRKSDVLYFYKPDIIGFNEDVKYIEPSDNLEWSCECYKMIFKVPSNYNLPNGLTFTLKEYCFGNDWTLTWDGKKWIGDNIQGRKNAKIVHKCNMRNEKDGYGATGCYCMVKKDEWNSKHIPAHTSGYAYSLFDQCATNGKYQTFLQFNDGSVVDASEYELRVTYSDVLRGAEYNGYDLVSVSALYQNYSTNTIDVDQIDLLYVDLTLPGHTASNRLSFTVSGVHHDSTYNRGHLDISGAKDTIEVVDGSYSRRSIDIEKSKDIILYLHKHYTYPIDEVNWDPTTNAFSYIVQQQYYEISPNPSAATTLYTDYNITSSKIITADNITTMRSDLNIVTNTVDVVSFDVKSLTNKVDVLDTQMTETREVTQHLQKDVKTNRIIASVALAFGVIGTVGSSASIGMQLASNGISFAAKGGTSMLKNCAAEGMEHEMAVEATTLFSSLPLETYTLRAANTVTDISPLIDWVNSEYSPITDIPYEEEYDDPKCKATSVYTSIDIANRFRDSLKPAFKLLVARITELTDSVDSIDEATSALHIGMNEQLANYINKNDLVRSDTVDGFARVDQENTQILLEFEDNIADGLLVFRTFASNDTVSRQRRFYVKVASGSITEYKGVQTDVEIEGIPVKGLANSETDRTTYMPNAELNDKFIYISYDPNYALTGVIIEHNTFTRQLVFTSNDLAYMCDIDALHKKIDALAEQSHSNDTAVMSIQEDYAMIDEVNEALKNYVLKSEMPPTVDLETYRQKNDLLSYTDTTCTKAATFEMYLNNTYNVYISYVEGTRFVFKYGEVTYNFVFTIDEQGKQGNYDVYDHKISDDLTLRWLSSNNGPSQLMILDSNNMMLKYELLSVIYPCPDEFALKSQIDELKAENAELRAQIALQPSFPWLSYYSEFTERLEYIDSDYVAKHIQYTYTEAIKQIYIVITNKAYIMYKDFVCILIDDAFETHYFRCDMVNKVVHYNEITNSTLASLPNTFSLIIPDGITLHTNVANQSHAFTYVFTTPD